MSGPVFVCGATGTQGGAVARHLRNANVPVHALVRDPTSPKAKSLEALGVTIYPGSWDDKDALKPALEGTKSAFLNFMPSFTDPLKELRDVETVLEAAKEAGVEHIVYSSAWGFTRAMAALPAYNDPSSPVGHILKSKLDAVDAVVNSGFSPTILLPGKFMSDFHGPGIAWFGNLSKTGLFDTALRKGGRIPFVDPNDIGAFGAAALMDPEKFAGQRVDIYTEILGMEEATAMLAQALGKKMSVRFMSDEEVEEKSKVDIFMKAQEMMRDIGEPDSMDNVKKWGIPVGSFRSYIEREKRALEETFAQVPDAN